MPTKKKKMKKKTHANTSDIKYPSNPLAHAKTARKPPSHLLRDKRRLAANRLAHDPRALQDGGKELKPQVAHVAAGQTTAAPGLPHLLIPIPVVFGNASSLRPEIDESPKKV